MPSPLILDKSYLDGASTAEVRQLFADFRVMCSETLFFELMTTRADSQTRCFSKLPTNPGAIALLPDLPPLLRAEMEAAASCQDIANFVIPGAYVFNAGLAAGTYSAPPEVKATLHEWRASVEAEARGFLGRCASVHQFFPELIGIEFRDFPAAVAAARVRVATDSNFVRSVFATFNLEDLPAKAPTPEVLTPKWAWFRWVQCQLIAALRMFERYKCRVPVEPSTGVLTRAEHSMHDSQYVVLATLAGAIASNDREVLEDVRLLAPEVEVVTTVIR